MPTTATSIFFLPCVLLVLLGLPFQAWAGSVSFSFTGSSQTFVVPNLVREVTIQAIGAAGSGDYANPTDYSGGADVEATISVTVGETLIVNVGGRGGFVVGGWNGGGNGANDTQGFASGGGGGATDVRQGGSGLENRVVVAGGGGGKAPTHDTNGLGYGAGGPGGTPNGGHGYTPFDDPSVPVGQGGNQTVGGFGGGDGGNGTFGYGGNASSASKNLLWAGGGGGGGWYGGGAGASDSQTGSYAGGSGGGGGSSYVIPTATQVSYAVASGPTPSVTILWTPLIQTNTTLTSSQNPIVVGASVFLTAQVVVAFASQKKGNPTGSVSFYNESTLLGTAVTISSSGVATLNVTALPVGTCTFQAVYSGDSTYFGSTGDLSETVSAPTTTTTTTTPPSTGQPSSSASTLQSNGWQLLRAVLESFLVFMY